ncbi:MAG: hypothetical protein WD314_15225 [Trueperaceae bacterium]
MDQNRYFLEAARAAWQRLSAEERAEAEAGLDAAVDGLLGTDELAPVVLRRLLVRAPDMRARLASCRPAERSRLDELIERLMGALRGDGAKADAAAGGHAAALYAQHLLAQALPLSLDVDSGRQLLRLLERVARHQELAPVARRRAGEQLADELVRAAGAELIDKAREILGEQSRIPAAAEWTLLPARLLLSVDRTSISCARYLAGLQKVERDSYGFDELRSGPAGRAKRVDQVTVKFDRPDGLSAPPGLGREAAGEAALAVPGSELKAKSFVALLSLAAAAAADGRSDGRQSVRLRDLLAMLGFSLGRGTNSGYYWRYYAELVRCLLFDLPNRVVAMQVSFAGAAEPLVVFERLLVRALPLDDQGVPLAAGPLRSLLLALNGEPEDMAAAVREAGVFGVEFAFSPELLAALGLTKPMNALEHVPFELLSLKGPAF